MVRDYLMNRSNASKASDTLADFTRDRRIIPLSLMAIIIGAMSAVVADALVWLIAVITNLAFYQHFSSLFQSPLKNHLGYVVVIIPIIGGLIVGFMARYGSDKIRGHGIPEALESILFGSSRMELRVAILKPLSSAIAIGTGGPFGAEGPIIVTGGAFGSLFAQLFHLSSAERKTLLVAGAAGGMSAIFATPVAAILLAVELLLFEWKPRSLIPVALSSAVAAALRVPLLGNGPIFPVALHAFLNGPGLVVAFLVGTAAGLFACLLTIAVYGIEDLFEKLPIHWMWWPAIGGTVVGIGGLIEPHVLGVGYDTIHQLLRGQIVGTVILGILIGKFIVWSVALGSGTSGGILAPLLMMGGALGAFVAPSIPMGDTGLWATVGMTSVMAGAMGSPLTAMIFALELTHDMNLLPALLVGSIAAHGVTVFLTPRSILTKKVTRRGYHISREYSIDPLTVFRVWEVMDVNPPTVSASMKVAELSRRITVRDHELNRKQATLIVDDEGRLAGIITRNDLLRALETDTAHAMTVLDAGTRTLIVAHPDELLLDAVVKMAQHNIGRLPVVSRDNHAEIVGYIGRSSVMAARRKKIEDEELRERGWKPKQAKASP
jgi:CIC family chloride channel protein